MRIMSYPPRHNASWSADLTEALRRTKIKYSNLLFQEEILHPLAGRLNRTFPGKEKTLFTPNEQNDVYERFKEGNEQIAARYLARDYLFRKPDIIRDVWKPNKRKIRLGTALFTIAFWIWKIPGMRRVMNKVLRKSSVNH